MCLCYLFALWIFISWVFSQWHSSVKRWFELLQSLKCDFVLVYNNFLSQNMDIYHFIIYFPLLFIGIHCENDVWIILVFLHLLLTLNLSYEYVLVLSLLFCRMLNWAVSCNVMLFRSFSFCWFLSMVPTNLVIINLINYIIEWL